MTWQSLPTWGKSVGVNRQRAHALLPRIPENCKRIKPTGWEIKVGTPKPEALKGGRKKKV